jgi:hypothetical protein
VSWFCNNPHCPAFTEESREVALSKEYQRQRIAAAKAVVLAQIAFSHSPVSRQAMRERAALPRDATWVDVLKWIDGEAL